MWLFSIDLSVLMRIVSEKKEKKIHQKRWKIGIRKFTYFIENYLILVFSWKSYSVMKRKEKNIKNNNSIYRYCLNCHTAQLINMPKEADTESFYKDFHEGYVYDSFNHFFRMQSLRFMSCVAWTLRTVWEESTNTSANASAKWRFIWTTPLPSYAPIGGSRI